LYILAAAVWLRFNPITPIQVLLLNLLYNDSRVAFPWWVLTSPCMPKTSKDPIVDGVPEHVGHATLLRPAETLFMRPWHGIRVVAWHDQ